MFVALLQPCASRKLTWAELWIEGKTTSIHCLSFLSPRVSLHEPAPLTRPNNLRTCARWFPVGVFDRVRYCVGDVGTAVYSWRLEGREFAYVRGTTLVLSVSLLLLIQLPGGPFLSYPLNLRREPASGASCLISLISSFYGHVTVRSLSVHVFLRYTS